MDRGLTEDLPRNLLPHAACASAPAAPLDASGALSDHRAVGRTILRAVSVEAGASLRPEQRAVLTKRLELARSTASALAKYSPRRETPPNARAIIPGSLDALLATVI